MKTEEKTKKTFDSVSFFRKVKEQIGKQLEGKSFKEQNAILEKYLSGKLKLDNF